MKSQQIWYGNRILRKVGRWREILKVSLESRLQIDSEIVDKIKEPSNKQKERKFVQNCAKKKILKYSLSILEGP